MSISGIVPALFFFLTEASMYSRKPQNFAPRGASGRGCSANVTGYRQAMCGMKIFAYTLGGALVAQEPQNNITRIAYEALAAVLGGVQTLATSSWDEAHSLPSEQAAHLSLRAQQILAYETALAKVVDPLGGSHYVEALTERLESEIAGYLTSISKDQQ